MISSLVLLFLQYIGVIDTDVSLGFWKYYIIAEVIEIGLIIFSLKKLDDWDLKTNYGQKKS